MEELVNSMKSIFNSIKKEDDSDKYLFFSPKYKPPVKIENWFLPQEAYPKDYDPYNPPGGDYFKSTYKRLGTQDVPLETTTQAMLKQICFVEPEVTVYKPLISFATDKLLEDKKEDYEDLGREEFDFVTTYEYDFRNPFPYTKTCPTKSEVKNMSFGLKKTPFNSTSEKCETKFLDDDLYRVKCTHGFKSISR